MRLGKSGEQELKSARDHAELLAESRHSLAGEDGHRLRGSAVEGQLASLENRCDHQQQAEVDSATHDFLRGFPVDTVVSTKCLSASLSSVSDCGH